MSTPELDRALEAYAQAYQKYRNAEHGQRRKTRIQFERANFEVLKCESELKKQRREARYGS